ncbi:MAG: LysM peptidoglycan-binding domain-containing protein [Bacilli bacterium]|jgi:LysM repeat protein
MKQIIPFKKDLLFKTKVSEITSISLEHTLKLEETDYINGEFIVSGDYKITEASLNLENYSFNIPFDITLDTKYKLEQAKVDIHDFYYEIINNEVLRVNIDVLIEGIELLNDVVIKDEEVEVLEINKEDEVEEEPEKEEVKEERTETIIETKEEVKSLFDSINEFDETFSTYRVYIVRENDSLETILTKYNISKEELSLYNDLDNLKLGDKIIIPALKNE